MSERREKMAAIVGDDHARARCARHLGNVRVVNATTCRTVLHRCLKKSQAIGGWEIMDCQPGKHFFLE